MAPGDIGHRGNYYTLGEQELWIDKRKGTGRTLHHFLQNPNKAINLEIIQSVSKWEKSRVVRNMYVLVAEVNAHSKDYQFNKTGRGQNSQYTLTEIKRKE